jgi:hypothetical protein
MDEPGSKRSRPSGDIESKTDLKQDEKSVAPVDALMQPDPKRHKVRPAVYRPILIERVMQKLIRLDTFSVYFDYGPDSTIVDVRRWNAPLREDLRLLEQLSREAILAWRKTTNPKEWLRWSWKRVRAPAGRYREIADFGLRVTRIAPPPAHLALPLRVRFGTGADAKNTDVIQFTAASSDSVLQLQRALDRIQKKKGAGVGEDMDTNSAIELKWNGQVLSAGRRLYEYAIQPNDEIWMQYRAASPSPAPMQDVDYNPKYDEKKRLEAVESILRRQFNRLHKHLANLTFFLEQTRKIHEEIVTDLLSQTRDLSKLNERELAHEIQTFSIGPKTEHLLVAIRSGARMSPVSMLLLELLGKKVQVSETDTRQALHGFVVPFAARVEQNFTITDLIALSRWRRVADAKLPAQEREDTEKLGYVGPTVDPLADATLLALQRVYWFAQRLILPRFLESTVDSAIAFAALGNALPGVRFELLQYWLRNGKVYTSNVSYSARTPRPVANDEKRDDAVVQVPEVPFPNVTDKDDYESWLKRYEPWMVGLGTHLVERKDIEEKDRLLAFVPEAVGHFELLLQGYTREKLDEVRIFVLRMRAQGRGERVARTLYAIRDEVESKQGKGRGQGRVRDAVGVMLGSEYVLAIPLLEFESKIRIGGWQQAWRARW